MGTRWTSIPNHLFDFIREQDIFFIATAPKAIDERINVSPKGYGGLTILDENTVGYLDLTGSGNETAAHLLQNGRVTILLCAMNGDPLLVRLYGRGRMIQERDADWDKYIGHFEAKEGQRQIMVMTVEEVSESCGYMIPIYDKVEDRSDLMDFARSQGPSGLEKYREDNNTVSVDGLPTGLVPSSDDF